VSGANIDYARMQRYLESLVPPRPPELAAMEQQAVREGFPIIGTVSGQVCYFLARLIGARRIFELGSGFGYSTAWFAQAVRDGGGAPGDAVVHHTVWEQALSDEARRHLDALGLGDLVRYHVGEAVAALEAHLDGPDADAPFDIVFMDIDKTGYLGALPAIRRALRPGGLLLVDNLLWDGRVWDPADQAPDTQSLRALAQTLADDPAWVSIIVPVRDGILAARYAGAARGTEE
jgi:caffeoyl-CoA O-methyltransferase